MGTVIQYPPRGNEGRHQRWDRIERAEQCERYGDLKAQGMSQRQAAKGLEVPRSTLQAWRTYQERLDECPAVVAFFHSVPGLAFLPYSQNIRTRLAAGGYAPTISRTSACLPPYDHGYSLAI